MGVVQLSLITTATCCVCASCALSLFKMCVVCGWSRTFKGQAPLPSFSLPSCHISLHTPLPIFYGYCEKGDIASPCCSVSRREGVREEGYVRRRGKCGRCASVWSVKRYFIPHPCTPTHPHFSLPPLLIGQPARFCRYSSIPSPSLSLILSHSAATFSTYKWPSLPTHPSIFCIPLLSSPLPLSSSSSLTRLRSLSLPL